MQIKFKPPKLKVGTKNFIVLIILTILTNFLFCLLGSIHSVLTGLVLSLYVIGGLIFQMVILSGLAEDIVYKWWRDDK